MIGDFLINLAIIILILFLGVGFIWIAIDENRDKNAKFLYLLPLAYWLMVMGISCLILEI